MAKKGKKKAVDEKAKGKAAKKASKRPAKDAAKPAGGKDPAKPETAAAAAVPVAAATPRAAFPELREGEPWKAVSLKMPVSYIAVVDEAARAYGDEGVSRSEFIRLALDAFIARQR